MTFTTKTRPVAGVQLKETINMIEERWMDLDPKEVNAETIQDMHRDLSELLGVVKAFMMAFELTCQLPETESSSE